mgnify:CR=1 FL=1
MNSAFVSVVYLDEEIFAELLQLRQVESVGEDEELAHSVARHAHFARVDEFEDEKEEIGLNVL